jgi:hypothetical protein
VTELSPLALHITHFVLHQARGLGCGQVLKAAVPTAQGTGYGPRLTALMGELAAASEFATPRARLLRLGLAYSYQLGGRAKAD